MMFSSLSLLIDLAIIVSRLVHERFGFVPAFLSNHLMVYSFNVSLSCLSSRDTLTSQKLVSSGLPP